MGECMWRAMGVLPAVERSNEGGEDNVGETNAFNHGWEAAERAGRWMHSMHMLPVSEWDVTVHTVIE